MNDTTRTTPDPMSTGDSSGTESGTPRGAPAKAPSPFGTRRGGRGRLVLRVSAYAALLLAAGTVTWLVTRGEEEAQAAPEHNHGAAPTTSTASPVSLDPEAARRIGVTFATATIGPIVTEIRTVGQLAYDETRVKAVSPKVDGWVEQLYVNFTGQEVREGEPLLSIYSPMLVTAQEELLLAARLAQDVSNGTTEAKQSAHDLLTSARRRLAYWDISASEIDRIERTGDVTKTLTLRAPVRGVVVEKMVLGGQRIMAGETVYRVADLSTVWVEGEVFERDLSLVRPGQRATLELEAYAGERWNGSVTFINPIVDPTTRTTRVRIEVRNPGLRLKPGMYATVRFPVAQRTRVLSVPRGAVLATGKRTLVFIRQPDGMLVPRDVVTGVASDDRIEIASGLQAGDVVVASATFLIDAESNLSAALGAMANMPGMDMGAPKQAAVPRATRDSSTDMSDMPAMDMGPSKGSPPVKRDTSGAHDHRGTDISPKPPTDDRE